jgi:hypothetical protein
MSEDQPDTRSSRPPLPAKRDDRGNVPAVPDTEAQLSTSPIASAMTGFQARLQTRALNEVAANIRARTEVQDAETTRRESALKLLRTVHKLEEAPEIVALDRAERQAERAAKYAQLSGSYEQLDENRDEHAHQAELRRLAREAEIERARKQIVEAQRETFTAKLGFDNQKQLKKLNLRIWRKRREGVQLDVEATTAQLREELAPSPPAQPNADDALRVKAEEALIAAAQRGDSAGMERWQRVLDALDGK